MFWVQPLETRALPQSPPQSNLSTFSDFHVLPSIFPQLKTPRRDFRPSVEGDLYRPHKPFQCSCVIVAASFFLWLFPSRSRGATPLSSFLYVSTSLFRFSGASPLTFDLLLPSGLFSFHSLRSHRSRLLVPDSLRCFFANETLSSEMDLLFLLS